MKSESEILATPLAERQKLWVELKQVATNDKDFATARAVVEVIEATDDWEAPKKLPVVATADTIIDGKAVKKGETVQVYDWQFAALRRYLVDPKEAEERKAKKAAKGGAAAALIAIILGLAFLCQTATAQVQTYLVGTQGQYNVQTVAGLNGNTNTVIGTNATYAVSTIVTNVAVVPNWSFVNGIWTNAPTTNVLSVVTNTPGVVSVVNYDSFGIQQSFALMGAGTGPFISSWDTSGDAINWQTNAFQISTTASGVNQVTTYTNMIQVQYGYIRLNTAWNAAATGAGDQMTNLYVEVIKKSNRQGP